MTDALRAVTEAMTAHGPLAVVVAILILANGFFIWRDWKREEKLQKQVDSLNKNLQDVVVPLMTQCQEAIKQSQEVIEQNSEILLRFIGRNER